MTKRDYKRKLKQKILVSKMENDEYSASSGSDDDNDAEQPEVTEADEEERVKQFNFRDMHSCLIFVYP